MNYVEEFFISIGFDTAKVKRESREIEAILDGMTKKKVKPINDEAKLKKKIKTEETKAEDGSLKAFVVAEGKKRKEIKKTKGAKTNYQYLIDKALDKTRDKELKREVDLQRLKTSPSFRDKVESGNRKQAVANLTGKSGGKITAKTSMFEPAIVGKKEKFSSGQQAQRQNDGILKNMFKQQKVIAAEQKANLKKEADNLRKEADNLRKEEASRGIYRAESKAKAEKMRNSAPYLRAESSGTLGNVGNLMDKAVMGGQLNKLYQLEYQLKKNTVATRKLNVAQKGLVDSSRNMIRSYASVFALFQGTVAIKRVGQEFEGMRSSMLAASGSAPAAAKDMQFVNDISQEMGLNLKDTTDAFVKFKFAAKGKMDNSEIEDLFQSVSMFGTALKVAPQDMKRAQRALSQISGLLT